METFDKGGQMSAFKAHTMKFICLFLTAVPSWAVAQTVGPWGVQPLEWRDDQISQVVALAGTGQKISVEGKDCLAGGFLNFNVRDDYAFDIDETVWLDVEFYMGSTGSQVSVSYDRNGVAPMNFFEPGARKQLQLPEGTTTQWYRQSIPLERARFANLGFAGSDFAIRAPSKELAAHGVTVCNLSLRRSYTTPVAQVFGWTAIDVVDERGQPTPARMGIYDPSGRLPLPSADALTLRSLSGATRVLPLGRGALPWPVKNRSVFYTDGRYHTRLPVGEYELIVAKGPEYRLAQQRFTVKANQTKPIKVKLRRWANMAANGWYSGEDHIHYARESEHDDHHLQLFTQAEDLRVANILQFGNIARTYMAHYDWKPVPVDHKAPFVLVPGQEDPRTTHRGHTIQLNIKEPVRDSARYLLYHEVFERVRAQGGLVGYAHVIDGDSANPDAGNPTARSMALDVPLGLVDFAEILSLHWAGVSAWFDFLNLGYKLSPAAGTDYPWGPLPGTVRNYVKIDRQFTPQAWFDELKKGRTFVTSGPMLELSINGHGMGSEIRVKSGEPLVIKAKASINPDIDMLSGLELIEQGEPTKAVSSQRGAPELELSHDLPAKQGTWFVVRARGKNPDVIALSAPIYVVVDGQGVWKRSEVPSIVAKMKRHMQEMLTSYQPETTEGWEAREPFAKYWDAQQDLLKQRIDQANAIYDDLVQRAATSANQP